MELRECEAHPAGLMRHMVAFDNRRVAEGLPGHFVFNMDSPSSPWHWTTPDVRPQPWSWQRQTVDELHDHSTTVILKARQLGATWLGCGYAVWMALFRPGSWSLMYRQKLDDAKKLIERCKILVDSLPEYLLAGAKVRTLKAELEFVHPGGQVSRILAQSSSDTSGHGDTVAFALLDEFARIEGATDIMAAVSPAVGTQGRMMVLSTANGNWDSKTQTGNYFAWLWKDAKDTGMNTVFLPWWFHADRDQEWLDNPPDEVKRLPEWKRREQFPGTPEEAFALTDACYFDGESLYWYAKNAIKQPLFQFHFNVKSTAKATLVKTEFDWISVYKVPDPERRYAIGADVASGHGLDFSAAYVVDLSTMDLCAEFHGRLDEDQFAEQLHYLGRWYGRFSGCSTDALLAIERGGGFGNATVISLTDGRRGRPAYSNLYRHREHVRIDHLVHKNIGFPMTSATRMPVIEHLESCLREKALPWLTPALHSEMGSFVRYDPKTGEKPSGTWPRAMQGTNDDLVMAAAITLEMYRERGHHPERRPRRRSKRPKPIYPWQEKTVGAD